MKIKVLIAKLEAELAEHGNLDVIVTRPCDCGDEDCWHEDMDCDVDGMWSRETHAKGAARVLVLNSHERRLQ